MKTLFIIFTFAFYINENAQIISTIAGTGIAGNSGDGGPSTIAKLRNPTKISSDAAGNIYFADPDNHRVRKINTNGIISTIAGTTSAGFTGDGGLAVLAKLYLPYGVDVDNAGNIYIADAGNSNIRKIDVNGIITTIAGNGNFGYSGDSGQATSAELYAPMSVLVDNTGNIFIADNNNCCIRKVDINGIISTVAGIGGNGSILTSTNCGYNGDNITANTAMLFQPYDMVTDAAGNLYIADFGNHRIRKVDVNGIITTVAGIGTAGYSGDGGLATLAELNLPCDVDFDNAGNMYITEGENGCVRKIDVNGIITTVVGTGTIGFNGDGGQATATQLNFPNGIELANGKIYIADSDNKRIRMICSGVANVVISAPSTSLCAGNFVTLTASGTDIRPLS